MSRRALYITLLSLALPAAPGRAGPPSAPDSTSLIVYGKHHAFFVDVPQGWRKDSDALKGEGICALFYRPAYTFENAPVILYVNTANLDSAGLDTFIAHDLDRIRKASPKLTLKPQPALRAGDGSEVKVFRLEHSGGPTTSELVGYLAAPTITIIFVASAKTPSQLDREMPAFAALVTSYGWMTNKVTINH